MPAAIRNHPAIFPPADVMKRVGLLEDVGEATVLYDRLWTELKSARKPRRLPAEQREPVIEAFFLAGEAAWT